MADDAESRRTARRKRYCALDSPASFSPQPSPANVLCFRCREVGDEGGSEMELGAALAEGVESEGRRTLDFTI